MALTQQISASDLVVLSQSEQKHREYVYPHIDLSEVNEQCKQTALIYDKIYQCHWQKIARNHSYFLRIQIPTCDDTFHIGIVID